MPWAVAGAVIGAAGTIYASNKSSSANQNALNAQLQSQQAAIQEQQREYDQTRQDQLPFLQAGYGALDKENAFLNGDWSGFENSPDYAFSLNQGIGALDKSAAAHGALYSGGHSADLMNYAEGTADQFANSYWNKLAGQAGQGQVSANNLGYSGQNMANNISNLYTQGGNDRASSYLNQANITNQEIGGLGNAFNQWLGYYQNTPSSSSGMSSYDLAPYSNSSFGASDLTGGGIDFGSYGV